VQSSPFLVKVVALHLLLKEILIHVKLILNKQYPDYQTNKNKPV